MLQAWRWFGPKDPVSLDDIRQAGATDIVTALHDVPIGEAWTKEAVAERKSLIETTPAGRDPLRWSVVESIPVADRIKRGAADAKEPIEAWIASLEALAANDVKIVCYNFMPVLDWTRTDLDWELPSGAKALRFDQSRFAAFDLYVLRRKGAEADYSPEIVRRAGEVFDAFSDETVATLTATIAAGLPGTMTRALDLAGLRDKVGQYQGVDEARIRANLVAFLQAVTPVAEALGIRLTLHPDDPPRRLFGLPRVAKNRADYAALFDAVPSPANGLCFCSASFGVDPRNDVVAMAQDFAARIHFAHLRSTQREPDGSFFEIGHLGGDVDMVGLIRTLLAEDARRPADQKIPFRADLGQQMLDDLNKTMNPGYSAIGRLKGLAELRGVIHALSV